MIFNCKIFLRLSAIAMALGIFLVDSATVVAEVPDSAAEHPNIVLIISDDQGWGDYRFMGHDSIQTPNLDRLARESVLFRHGYVPSSLCRPSLLTLITGHYAHTHGVTGNDPSQKYAAPDSELYRQRRSQLISYIDKLETLPELLAEQGYLSHQSGKWWEGSYRRGGFTHGMTRGFPKLGGRHGDDGLSIGRKGLGPIEQFVETAQAAEKPFFLWYAPFLPHLPHNPPERLLTKYRNSNRPTTVAQYYATCQWFDETCGQLVDILEEKGVRENTLIVYVTDNGWIQDPLGKGSAPRSKQSPYEGGVRTPIMFSWPGNLRPEDRPELVSSIDLVPTILAAAGARQPADLPGLNLWQALKSGSEIERKTIFGEGFAHDIADIENPEGSLLYRWCVEGRWKLILSYNGEVYRHASTHTRTETGPQLFDLKSDPIELNNVAVQYPDVVERLALRIANWYSLEQRELLTGSSPPAKGQ